MSRPLILVVEDNAADVSLLRIALDSQREEYDLTVLRDGEEALRFVEKRTALGTREPCVILLDLHLPKYDGMEILRALKETASPTHLNILMLSSIARQEEERRSGAGVRCIGTSR